MLKIPEIISEEKFIPVKGFEGLYEVSNHGRIKSLLRKNKFGHNILTGKRDKDGYISVVLVKNKKPYYLRAHRIVAETWLENEKSLKVVHHINNIKDDNRIYNLQWSTISDNTKHAYSIGVIVSPNKGKKGKDNKISREFDVLDLNGNFISREKGVMEYARKNGFSCSFRKALKKGTKYRNNIYRYV